MTKKDKMNLAHWAISKAKESGAQDASVSIYNYIGTDINVREQKIEKIQKSIQSGLSISLYVDNKYSSHSTSRLDKKELAAFIIEAVKSTKYLGEDKYRQLPDEKLYYRGGGIDLKLVDDSFSEVSLDEKINLAKKTEKLTIGIDKRIINVTANYTDGFVERVKVTSNGFEGDEISTSFSLSASASIDGGESRPQDYDYVRSHFFKDIKADKIGKNAVERAVAKIGAQKIETGRYEMLIENRVVSRVLSGLESALAGSNLQQKTSFLEGMKGEKITSSKLSITDNPLIISGSASKLFDREGLESRKREIIKDGVLKSFYIGTYYARKLDVEPTTRSSSNLEFKLGKKELAELVKKIKKGIFVTEFNGGNSNSTTGDFSYGVSGFLVENGKIIKPISGMNITDNHKEFWMKLVEVGSDELKSRAWRTASLLFKDINFSGL